MSDIEKGSVSRKSTRSNFSPTSPYTVRASSEPQLRQTFAWKVIDSFRRDPDLYITPYGALGANGRVFWAENAARATANSPLARKLKSRHLQMIAIGGSIGAGLFVASGKALHTGGPASLLISFASIGAMLYCTMHALGEMAVLYPVAGSFSAYSTRFLDPAWGFAMGWNYAMQWLAILPLEIIAASITINYWEIGQGYNHAIFVTIFLIVIISINLIGVKGYGEAEFAFALVKIVAIIGYILLGAVMNCGGNLDSGYIGGTYWNNPGAFHNGFKGFCSVFVTASLAFSGTELVGLTAAETSQPRKSIPIAIKQVFWRITLFYLGSLTVIGLLVPYNEPRLLQAGPVNAAASPFVISIQNAGIDILPSIMNCVILIAVLSVGNSAIFGSSRTIAALADQGQAPKILGYVDKKGRPLMAILASSAAGLLAYLVDSSASGTILDWIIALSGLSSIFTWGSICLAHIRFRRAWKVQGHTLDELAFRSQPGVIGSWIGFIFNVVVLIAQFWTGAWPVGYEETNQVENFFVTCLAAPIVILFYITFKLWFRTPIMRSRCMDLRTGMREFDSPTEIAEKMAERASWPRWKRIYRIFC